MGTAVEDRNQSADGSMATMAQGVRRRKEIGMDTAKHQTTGWREQRAEARMRLCLKLGQGAKPPETPAPFPCCLIVPNGSNLSRVRKPRTKRAPLTDSFPFGSAYQYEGKGAYGLAPNSASRWSALGSRGEVDQKTP
jgi:hypothetical protein